VNLQDAQPHGPRPGAPGPHRQVMEAAFEPRMSIWAPVVLGGCLGCSIWSINSKRRPLRTMGVARGGIKKNYESDVHFLLLKKK
jgi:hypothetical protein